MVDKEKRDAVKKIGTVGALLLGGAGGKVYWWDRRDDDIDPTELEQAIEDRAATYAEGQWGGWDAPLADLSRAEATIQSRQTTSDGGERYDAILNVPLQEGEPVCAEGEPAALASALEAEANDAFTALYNATHLYAAASQQPFEDGIEAYEIRFSGEDGAATARFTSRQAVEIGGTALMFDPYDPGDTTDEAYRRFTKPYYDAFTVECEADG